MPFHSILFPAERPVPEPAAAPAYFADLHLDQIVAGITLGRAEYQLQPFFYTPLAESATIGYRQEVMRDLEQDGVYQAIRTFTQQMRAMRDRLALAAKLPDPSQRQRWFLAAVDRYCATITSLDCDLRGLALQSRGLIAWREYLARYIASAAFTALLAATHQCLADLASVKYCLLIKGNCIRVRPYAGEPDYTVAVEDTFAKFRQGAVKDYKTKFRDWPEMVPVEAKILEGVAQLYPAVFRQLDQYCADNAAYLDLTIAGFDREIQFYVAYLDYIAPLRRAGLPFCYPEIAVLDKEIQAEDGFDLALAYKLVGEKGTVVGNDFYLRGPERIVVITGPNQGGKTTFARAFGQLHYLAALGCLVPGRAARLFLFDRLFTHFAREETVATRRGQLQDELVRIHAILRQATGRSIIILNEIFTATTLDDAVFLSHQILGEILRRDVLCVCVTFLDELATLSPQTVSMVGTIVPDNPAQRTYKFIRWPADGLAYALAIAEKHGLTYARLKERIPP
jgi:hypothetical protein